MLYIHQAVELVRATLWFQQQLTVLRNPQDFLVSEALMKTVEEIYKQIAQDLIWFVGEDSWQKSVMSATVWKTSTQSSFFRLTNGKEIRDNKFLPLEKGLENSAAILFLRDDLLKTTGQRIWGLTFTLYPDGKFNIDYDYNKPEGYEESDEVITGDEINASLSKPSTKTNT
jgi:hypothetical protein